MSIFLQTALAAETHLAEGLTLKLRFTLKVEWVVSDRPSVYAQTKSIQNRWANNFAIQNINKEKSIKMHPL
jgi:hypothetical protein